jgi:hypothetical protein
MLKSLRLAKQALWAEKPRRLWMEMQKERPKPPFSEE